MVSDMDNVNFQIDDERRFIQLIDSMPKVAVQGYDKERRVIYWNDASTSLYGYTKDETLGAKLEELILFPDDVNIVVQAHKNWLHNGVAIPAAELLLKHKDGHPLHVFSSHVMLNEHSDNPEMFCIDVDLNTQYAMLDKLEHTLRTDKLTKLPNRQMLHEQIDEAIIDAEALNQKFAVIIIDLDDFKEINNSIGHDAGDELLIQVASRIKPLLKNSDILARSGGDEYVCLLPQIESQQDIINITEEILASFNQAFQVSEFSLFITASIGIAIYPDCGMDMSSLIRHADTAMYKAKDSGKNQYRFFNEQLKQDLTEHKLINSALRNSLIKNEFSLVYQPILSMDNPKHIESLEALIRWYPEETHEFKTTPDHFIPLAERTNLIVRIGDWVLRETCKQLRKWKDDNLNPPLVSVNISGKQLEQKDFISNFYALLDTYQLKPQDIGFELTEHYLIHITDKIQSVLKELQRIGVQISIDDFGTGYSSLSYLSILPIDKLKIDRSFILQAPQNTKSRIIIEELIHMGKQLGFTIIVEGIETPEHEQLCANMGANLAQGYMYHRPMTATDTTSLLEISQK